MKQKQDKRSEIEMFNQMAQDGGYFHLSKHKYLNLMKSVFNHSIDTKTLNILDLGCGVGEQAEVISSLGYNVVGVDISYSAAKIAQNTSKHKKSNVNYLVADIEHLPFKEFAFDICFCGLVFHHFPDLKHVANQIGYVLKNEGKLISYDPNGFNPYEFIGVYIIKFIGGVSWKTKNERFLLPKELVNEFSRAGFHKFRFDSILLFSENKTSYFYRLRSLTYDLIYRFMPGIAKGNMILMRCEKLKGCARSKLIGLRFS